MPLLNEFLDADSLAKELNITRRTLNRWISGGYGPPSVKLGSRRVFKLASVKAWLDQAGAQVLKNRHRGVLTLTNRFRAAMAFSNLKIDDDTKRKSRAS